MSSGRSRSAGTRISRTFRRNSRSSRKRPPATSVSRFRLVAATTRTSALRVRVSPTRSNCFSCRKRSNFAWRGRGRSPISSRNNVPPSAASTRPGWSRTAPVNAPLACPNSSLASSSSVSVGQLTVTNGRSRRLLWTCIARASTPLPGAVFTAKQHGRVGLRRACHDLEDGAHRRRLRFEIDVGRLRLQPALEIGHARGRASAASSTFSIRWRI